MIKPALRCFFAATLLNGAAIVLAQPDATPQPTRPETRKTIGLVVHGGAGTIERSEMTPEKERKYRGAIEQALTAGDKNVKRWGSGHDGTQPAVRVAEGGLSLHVGKGDDSPTA